MARRTVGRKPTKPSNLTVVSLTATTAQLAWQDNSTDETGFQIQRRIVGAAWFDVVTLLVSGTTTYVDTVTASTAYEYRVRAMNLAGQSPYSNVATLAANSNVPQVTPPTAPSNLAATPGNEQAGLAWTASDGGTSYIIKRGTISGGPYTSVGTTTGTAFTDTGLTNGIPYFWIVLAVNSAATSSASNQATATPVGTPGVGSVSYGLTTGWATFGLPLNQGVASTAVKVGALTTQTDVKTRWSDGSIRFAIVSTKVTSNTNYTIEENTAPSGTFTPTVPAVTVTIMTPAGAIYIATCPTTLTDLWLDGPLVKEGRAIRSFTNATGVYAHLRAFFDVRVYSDGAYRVDVTLDNTINISTANVAIYSVSIKIGGVEVFARSSATTGGPNTLTQSGDDPMVSTAHGLAVGDWVRLTSGTYAGQFRRVVTVTDANTVVLNSRFSGNPSGATWEKITFLHPYMSRWRKVLTGGGYAASSITPTFTPGETAGAHPKYLSTVANTDRSVAGSKYLETAIGDLAYPWALVGDRQELGLYPAWVAQYLVHKTQNQRAYVLKMGDLAGSFSIHCTEPDGTRTNLDTQPGFFFGAQGNSTGTTGPAGGGPEAIGRGYFGEDGAAHQPSLAYIPYLLTGDRYYLDELKSLADYAMMSWLWLREDGDGLMTAQQLRGCAWGLRDVVDATVCCPDTDPDKAYFTLRLANNLASLTVKLAGEADPLGGSHNFRQEGGIGEIQMFYQSFFLWALDHVRAQGFGTHAYLTRVATYWNTLAGEGAPWTTKYVCAYLLNITNASGTYFSTLGNLWTYNFGASGLYQQPATIIGSYGVNLRVMLAIAKGQSLTGASANLTALMAYSDGGGNMADETDSRSQYAIDV